MEGLSAGFLASAVTPFAALLFVLPVIYLNLYAQVNLLWLNVWTLAIIACLSYRLWITYRFRRPAPWDADWLARLNRHLWAWPATAVVWGASMLLYLDIDALATQLICIMCLVGIVATSMPSMTCRLDCFLGFLHSLMGTCLTAICWHLLTREVSTERAYFAVYLTLLLLVFWIFLRYAGSHLHRVIRQAFELQYDHENLIATLRAQSATALQAIATKDRLLATAAHDLRQPVHALAFYAGWMRNEPEIALDVLPKILAATDSVNALFNSLFDFARIESGSIQPRPEAIAVTDVVSKLLIEFGPAADLKKLTLRVHVPHAVVWSDAVLLHRIAANLVSNALRYTDQGGVLIGVRLRAKAVWLEVWDTGQGIVPEHLPHIFREYYKGTTHQGTEEGFGLGLAIVKRLADMLGHRVWVVSVPGRGSLFRVELTRLATNSPVLAPNA